MMKKSKIRAETRKNNRAQREDMFDASIAQFDADIEEAGKITNPAEKILRLDEIRQNVRIAEGAIRILVTSETDDIALEATRAGDKAFFIFMPTLVGPMIADNARRKSVLKKLEAEAENHLQKMGEQQAQMCSLLKALDVTINVAAENDVIEISQSLSCEQVLQVPGVTAIFAKAAAKQIAVYAAQLAEAAPPQDEAAARKHSQAHGVRLLIPGK